MSMTNEMISKKIWIWNHYATEMYVNRGGRHYYFAKYLRQSGYDVTIFCATTLHDSNEVIDIGSNLFAVKYVDDIRFVFVRATSYTGNGLSRIKNMGSFFRNVKKTAIKFGKDNGKPDVIIASSVHPLTLVAGLKTAKDFGVPCICEIRDLWPESIVSYGFLSRRSPITKYLFRQEKIVYKRADQLIFTMEGGAKYIIERGWDSTDSGSVDLTKVHHINNGVDLESFDDDAHRHQGTMSELFSEHDINLIYSGSVRKVNNLELIIEPVTQLIEEGLNVRLIVVGGGDQIEYLKERYVSSGDGVIFAGRVNKQYIPSLLQQSDVCVLCSTHVPLSRYGISQNKLFEYMAAGKPVLSLVPSAYDLMARYGFGICSADQSVECVKNAIRQYHNLEEGGRNKMGRASRKASEDFDFRVLTDKLIEVIESALMTRKSSHR